MIMGVLYAKKRYPLQKYFFVFLIVIGVAIFTYKDRSGKGIDSEQGFGWGEILLVRKNLQKIESKIFRICFYVCAVFSWCRLAWTE